VTYESAYYNHFSVLVLVDLPYPIISPYYDPFYDPFFHEPTLGTVTYESAYYNHFSVLVLVDLPSPIISPYYDPFFDPFFYEPTLGTVTYESAYYIYFFVSCLLGPVPSLPDHQPLQNDPFYDPFFYEPTLGNLLFFLSVNIVSTLQPNHKPQLTLHPPNLPISISMVFTPILAYTQPTKPTQLSAPTIIPSMILR
jgi:hypothetical protein